MKGEERSMIRAIRGPVTLITVGVLFGFNNFTEYGFERTWPVILIVFGLLSLLGRGMEQAPPPPPGYPPPPQGFPQGNTSAAGSYAQSTYSQPAGGAAKGGFGQSGAATRQPETQDPPGGSQ